MIQTARDDEVIKLALAITGYFCLSFILFLSAAPTINGAIIYIFVLLPLVAFVVLGWWILAWRSRHQTAQLNYRIWGIILMLQGATLITSPGNCSMANRNARCYSNLQIWLGHAPRTGAGSVPHWTLVEDAFLGFAAAYGVAVLVALVMGALSVEKSISSTRKN